MGYYINRTKNGSLPIKDKARALVEYEGATIVLRPSLVEPDKAIICVVDNGDFEAASYCYDKNEFDAFNDPYDYRPKIWLHMDKERTKQLTGCNR